MSRPFHLTALAAALGLAVVTGATGCGSGSHGPGAIAGDAASGGGAQSAQGGQRSGRMMGKILLSLGLSDSQKARIRAIRDATFKENRDVTDRAQRRENMRKMFAQINAVLTPAQQAEFKTKLEAMRKHRQEQAPPADHG